jgi:hypothetical protein
MKLFSPKWSRYNPHFHVLGVFGCFLDVTQKRLIGRQNGLHQWTQRPRFTYRAEDFAISQVFLGVYSRNFLCLVLCDIFQEVHLMNPSPWSLTFVFSPIPIPNPNPNPNPNPQIFVTQGTWDFYVSGQGEHFGATNFVWNSQPFFNQYLENLTEFLSFWCFYAPNAKTVHCTSKQTWPVNSATQNYL